MIITGAPCLSPSFQDFTRRLSGGESTFFGIFSSAASQGLSLARSICTNFSNFSDFDFCQLHYTSTFSLFVLTWHFPNIDPAFGVLLYLKFWSPGLCAINYLTTLLGSTIRWVMGHGSCFFKQKIGQDLSSGWLRSQSCGFEHCHPLLLPLLPVPLLSRFGFPTWLHLSDQLGSWLIIYERLAVNLVRHQVATGAGLGPGIGPPKL